MAAWEVVAWAAVVAAAGSTGKDQAKATAQVTAVARCDHEPPPSSFSVSPRSNSQFQYRHRAIVPIDLL